MARVRVQVRVLRVRVWVLCIRVLTKGLESESLKIWTRVHCRTRVHHWLTPKTKWSTNENTACNFIIFLFKKLDKLGHWYQKVHKINTRHTTYTLQVSTVGGAVTHSCWHSQAVDKVRCSAAPPPLIFPQRCSATCIFPEASYGSKN